MTTQEKLLTALDDKYKAYSFYAVASENYGIPFSHLLEAEANHISALSWHLQKLGWVIPTNPHQEMILPESLVEVLQMAIANERASVALYNMLIEGEQNPLVLDTFYRLQAASFNDHIPTLLKSLEQGTNPNFLTQLNQGKALLEETGEMVAKLQNGELTQGQLESFLNKLNYSLMGGMILGAFGAIILNEFLNQNKE